MDKKHELTEKLKVLENDIYDAKVDLQSINRKLEAAYQYEDELAQRQAVAKKKTEELRNKFFIKSGNIAEMYHSMKNIFDIFTGNFLGK